MRSLFQVVYTSTVARDFSRAELMALLKGCVQRNVRTGITSLLLYQHGRFIQVLEGEEAAVICIFAKISRDPRHHHVIPLIHEPIEQRCFPNSAMAFRDLDSSEPWNLPGDCKFLAAPSNAESWTNNIPKCQRLLLLFRQNEPPGKGRPTPTALRGGLMAGVAGRSPFCGDSCHPLEILRARLFLL